MSLSDLPTVDLGGKAWPLSMSVAALRRIGTALGIKGVNPSKIIAGLDPEDFGSVALFVHSMIPPSASPPTLAEVEEMITVRSVREAMASVHRAIAGDEPEEDADDEAGSVPPTAPSA